MFPPDLQEPFAVGRAALRGRRARRVHGRGQLAHDEVVAFAQALDGHAHLPRRRRGVHLFMSPPLGGREQSGGEIQVFGPDVDGEPRPQVVGFLEHIARGTAFKRGVVVAPFRTSIVYNIMACVLRLKPAPNDGSQRAARTVLAKEVMLLNSSTMSHRVRSCGTLMPDLVLSDAITGPARAQLFTRAIDDGAGA